jgi:hypothetical protein
MLLRSVNTRVWYVFSFSLECYLVKITVDTMTSPDQNILRQVEEYKASITKQTLYKSGGEIRVWDTPRCFADGAELIDALTEPTEATAIEEQLECYGAGVQRIKIRYGDGREGWVLDNAVEKTC